MPKHQNFLTKQQIQSVLDLKQKDAAVKLCVSLASLKRYYQKFFPGQRWPRSVKEREKRSQTYNRPRLNNKIQKFINEIDEIYNDLDGLSTPPKYTEEDSISLEDCVSCISTHSHGSSDYMKNESTSVVDVSSSKYSFSSEHKQSTLQTQISEEGARINPIQSVSQNRKTPYKSQEGSITIPSQYQPFGFGNEYITPFDVDASILEFVRNDSKIVAAAIKKLLIQNELLQQEYLKQNNQLLALQKEIYCQNNDNPAAYITLAKYRGDMQKIDGPWQSEIHIQNCPGFAIDEYFNIISCTESFRKLTGFTEDDCLKGINLMQCIFKIYTCKKYIQTLKRFHASPYTRIEFNDTFKRKDGKSCLYLRILLRRDKNLTTWGWATEAPYFMDRMILDNIPVAVKVSPKSTTTFTDEDSYESHMHTMRLLIENLGYAVDGIT